MLCVFKDKKRSVKKHLFTFPVFDIMFDEVLICIPSVPLEAQELFKCLFH